MNREHREWDSPSLGRPMELIWYGHWGRPVLAFPTSLGRAWQNEERGLIGGLADKIEGGEIQVCCVDSVDGESWYNGGAHPAWKVQRHDHYDRYLADEVIPFIRDKARREDVVAYGASFGAYHAVNFAFRHPDRISRTIAFSGVFDIHRFLGGHWDDACYFHCPTAYVANYDQEWTARIGRMGIVLATGEHDHLVRETREFSALLSSKGIPHHAEVWPGVFGHDWPWWTEHLRRFVP
ncbi:MAG TPA: alpha/beta hydrolase-fold protein [Candidatus Polarisedimenticolia bacterium]|nr:alpha/beta hydrolase-fold protein [Candidatus Polarisedimenticolia bacterium]